ncbi:pyruvate kinase-like [Ctenocephalides felis]|uniref:pyruvate kinase-like n=1 Tax=Ctenocephalides felis TaxID=7515 RepID=UPI000E6E59FA|nr:pyruvate kinase-like [Ctenocephalides felis]
MEKWADQEYILPWDVAVDAIRKSQIKSTNAQSHIEHMSNMKYDCDLKNSRITQIMCTIGPNSEMPQQIETMLELGMTIARINMVHGDLEHHRQELNSLRMSNNNYSTRQGMLMTLGIAIEPRGSEVRTGQLANHMNAVPIEEGSSVRITCDPAFYASCGSDLIYLSCEHLRETVKPGNRIVIDNGEIILRVLDIGPTDMTCKVLSGGNLGNDRKVTLPEVPIETTTLSNQTKLDLLFAVKYEVDFVIVKRVRFADQIKQYRAELGEEGQYIQMIAKIETLQGLENLEEILEEADAIMFSKHDMATEMPVENVCLAQKYVLGRCILASKPCVCEVHTAHAGTTVTVSSRAIADAHSTIIDGADCVMLAGETALGSNPINSVLLLDKVCRQSELSVWQTQMYGDRNVRAIPPNGPAESIAIGAVETSIKCNAQAIIVLTTSGRSAKLLSHYAPRCPIVAVTRHGRVARQLQLYRGVKPLQYIYGMLEDWMKDVNIRLQYGISYGKVSGFIRAGDAVLMVHGCRQGAGFTNTLRVVYASEYDTIPA